MADISRDQGDTLTRIYVTLTQDGAARDLTGKTVKIYIQDNAGNLVVDGDDATIDDAEEGQVSWNPATADMVSPYTWAALVGRCPMWFRVFDSTLRDTHPIGEKQLILIIYPGPN